MGFELRYEMKHQRQKLGVQARDWADEGVPTLTEESERAGYIVYIAREC